MLQSPAHLDFAESLSALFAAYQHDLRADRLSLETDVFLRFHLSDIVNQTAALQDVLEKRGTCGIWPIS
jgi:hypothetical protein